MWLDGSEPDAGSGQHRFAGEASDIAWARFTYRVGELTLRGHRRPTSESQAGGGYAEGELLTIGIAAGRRESIHEAGRAAVSLLRYDAFTALGLKGLRN